ncbi:hypothetical protein BJ742DRAFT_863971 [Cladochytrium replicatum]|nr:hypothetical protein BJ742DRAFT_863971 [Cladochytrium replicatum]
MKQRRRKGKDLGPQLAPSANASSPSSQPTNFVIPSIGASARSSGKTYVEATKWKQAQPIPDSVLGMIVHHCKPEHFFQCLVIFSGFDSDGDFAGIFSNGKTTAFTTTCPLSFQGRDISRGFLVTNANCSTTGLVVPLKALQDKFGPLSKFFEEMMEIKASMILGSNNSAAFGDADASPLQSCAVLDGHTECVSLESARRSPPSLEEIRIALADFSAVSQKLACYSAHQAIISVTVCHIRDCSAVDVKFVLLSHNTVLGAAGSILNAEIALA